MFCICNKDVTLMDCLLLLGGLWELIIKCVNWLDMHGLLYNIFNVPNIFILYGKKVEFKYI